jgi:hypothetical protein
MGGFIDWKLSYSTAVRCHVLLESLDVLVLMAMQRDIVYSRTNVHGIEQKSHKICSRSKLLFLNFYTL